MLFSLVDVETKRWFICSCCVVLNGILGLLVVLNGYTIEDLAEDVNGKSTDISFLFITAFIGSVVALSTRLYFSEDNQSWNVLYLVQFFLLFMIACLPYCTERWELYTLYFFSGASFGTIDISCVDLFRVLQKGNAPNWINYYMGSFYVCGVFLATVQLSSLSWREEYMLVCVFIALSFIMLIQVANPYTDPDFAEDVQTARSEQMTASTSETDVVSLVSPTSAPVVKHYWVDIICAIALAFGMGAKASIDSYLMTFINDSGVDVNGTNTFLIYFGCIAVGFFLWVPFQDQVNGDTVLYWTFGIYAILLIPHTLLCFTATNAISLQVNLYFLALLTAPSVNVCFNLCFCYTLPSTTSSFLLMLGMSSGIYLLPFLTAAVWDSKYGNVGPYALFYMSFCYMACALLFLPFVPYCSYLPSVSTITSRPSQSQYMELRTDDEDLRDVSGKVSDVLRRHLPKSVDI